MKILLKNRDFFLRDKIVSNVYGTKCAQKVPNNSNNDDDIKLVLKLTAVVTVLEFTLAEIR